MPIYFFPHPSAQSPHTYRYSFIDLPRKIFTMQSFETSSISKQFIFACKRFRKESEFDASRFDLIFSNSPVQETQTSTHFIFLDEPSWVTKNVAAANFLSFLLQCNTSTVRLSRTTFSEHQHRHLMNKRVFSNENVYTHTREERKISLLSNRKKQPSLFFQKRNNYHYSLTKTNLSVRDGYCYAESVPNSWSRAK